MQDEDWLSRRYYGGDLPEAAERALHQAALAFADQAVAEEHLRRAWRLAPGHLEVSLGAYKFYLYHHRLAEALPYVKQCLALAAKRNGLDDDWRQVRPEDADFGGIDESARLFLFSLMAYGYVSVRLGALAEGRQVLRHLLTLDPADKLGAAGVLALVDHPSGDEDEDA